MESEKFQKSHNAEKNLSEEHLDSQSVFSRLWTSVLFLFVLAWFWGLVYWTSVVHQVVEQMNKKVDRSRLTDEKNAD